MSNPWHRGFHWTPQNDKRWGAFLCERISKFSGSPIENFDTSLSPWFEDENSDELLNCIWWEW